MDRRQFPANDRVVAAWLADRRPDLTPVEPEICYVTAPVLDLSLEHSGRRDRQLLYGSRFEVFERRDGQAFGLSIAADYAGWVDETLVAPEATRGEPLEWVSARQTHAYSKPDFKSPERLALPHLSLLCGGRTEGRFTETEVGWVPTAHLSPLEELATLTPSASPRFSCGRALSLGRAIPRSGIDCSGLVQNATCLATTGHSLPRRQRSCRRMS